jgi:hypothetical protein
MLNLMLQTYVDALGCVIFLKIMLKLFFCSFLLTVNEAAKGHLDSVLA